MQKKRFFRTGVLLGCAAAILIGSMRTESSSTQYVRDAADEIEVTTELYAGIMADIRTHEVAYVQENQELLVMAALENALTEEDVYSFLQGPKSWGNGV